MTGDLRLLGLNVEEARDTIKNVGGRLTVDANKTLEEAPCQRTYED